MRTRRDTATTAKNRRTSAVSRAAAQAILIVGAGGLGVPAATALARAGAKRLILCDPDPVELSNLARQVIYRTADIGSPKAMAAARRLLELNPALSVISRELRFAPGNARELVAECAFVIDATDDPETKFLINDVCVAAGRAFVYGGVLGMRGQAMTVIPGRTACLRCLFEGPPDPGETASCRAAGIVGPVAAAIGELQADEAMSFLAGRAPSLAGAILTYDAGAGCRVRMAAVAARERCECGAWSAPARRAAHN